jgi:hypothetical protein
MSSSQKSLTDEARFPLVREGGVPYRPLPGRNPFDAWIALMEVVEALCPRWPERPPIVSGVFRL